MCTGCIAVYKAYTIKPHKLILNAQNKIRNLEKILNTTTQFVTNLRTGTFLRLPQIVIDKPLLTLLCSIRDKLYEL